MKRTRALKRSIALLLAVLALTLTGCKSGRDLPTATVLTPDWQEVELPLITIVADEYCWMDANLKSVVKSVPGYDKEFTAEIVMLDNEPERSMYLDRMRVELMAGKGPDLFLCDCLYGNVLGGTADEGDGPMFNFPQQLMENRIFLPLDWYMEKAEYMEPDKLLPQLMELGRNDEGQLIIPLQYDFTVTCVPEDKYTEPAEKSRKGLVESGDPYLEFAGRNGVGMGFTLLDCFGADADYPNDELTFTEDELLDAALDLWESERLWNEGYYAENAPGVTQFMFSDQCQKDTGEDISFVPTYNRDGGVTAFVTNYAAINRNASYPEYAFHVLDVLAGRAQMKQPTLYGWSIGLVTHSDYGDTEPFGQFSMSESRREQYLELRDSITAVKFLTALDRKAYYGIVKVCQAEGTSREDVEKAVTDTYRTMKMMLAES